MPDVAYVNGRFGALRSATVSIQDRGFLFGDGAYEVLRTYGGRLFEVEAHLERLDATLSGLRIRRPLSRTALRRVVESLVVRCGYPEARVYVQVTRGTGPRQHAFPSRGAPTLVAWAERLVPLSAARRRRGVTAITLADPRWARCDLKAVALLANVLAKQAAVERGADEAILVGGDGTVREGSTANVFVVQGRTLRTHPLGPEILAGVSRSVLLGIAPGAGFRVREARFDRRALFEADEVLLSSTTSEIVGVVRIDARRIGNGRPGPAAAALWEAFQARVRRTARRPARRR